MRYFWVKSKHNEDLLYQYKSEKLSLRKGWLQWSGSKISACFCPKNILFIVPLFLQISKKNMVPTETFKVFRPRPQSQTSLQNSTATFTRPRAFFSARNPKENTLPETDVWKRLEVDGWKTILSFWGKSLFSGVKWVLVSGRVNGFVGC